MKVASETKEVKVKLGSDDQERIEVLKNKFFQLFTDEDVLLYSLRTAASDSTSIFIEKIKTSVFDVKPIFPDPAPTIDKPLGSSLRSFLKVEQGSARHGRGGRGPGALGGL